MKDGLTTRPALFGESLTLEDEARIAARLEDIGLPVAVDLLRHSTIQSEELRAHVARYGVSFYDEASPATSQRLKPPSA